MPEIPNRSAKNAPHFVRTHAFIRPQHQQVIEQISAFIRELSAIGFHGFDDSLHRFLADLLGDLRGTARQQLRGIGRVGIAAPAAFDHAEQFIENGGGGLSGAVGFFCHGGKP